MITIFHCRYFFARRAHSDNNDSISQGSIDSLFCLLFVRRIESTEDATRLVVFCWIRNAATTEVEELSSVTRGCLYLVYDIQGKGHFIRPISRERHALTQRLNRPTETEAALGRSVVSLWPRQAASATIADRLRHRRTASSQVGSMRALSFHIGHPSLVRLG